jgi:hypothetical protein
MRKILALFFLLWSIPAYAGVTCSLPYTFTNGTVADATQVMANYNALVTCLTNAAHSGANNDITSLSALTTPLTPGQGGSNVYIGASPTTSGSEILISGTTPTGYGNTQGYSVVFNSPLSNTGPVTIAVNGTPNVVNLYKQSTAGPVPLTGGELVNGQVVFATYDGTEMEINPVPSVAAGWGLSQNASATAIQIATTNPPYPYGAPVNLSLSAIATGSLLQISILNNSGVTPAATSPVLIPFSTGTGAPTWVALTSALTMNTNAVGATLGSSNNWPFRFWVVVFDNSGTLVPALFNASITTPVASTQIFSLNPAIVASTTAISNASKSAGIFYTPNGTTLSSQPYSIVGYLDYASGLATAGTYSGNPTTVQPYGPQVKLPGTVVQSAFGQSGTMKTYTGLNPTSTTVTLSIAPESPVDPIWVQSSGPLGCYNTSTTNACYWALYRGAQVATVGSISVNGQLSTNTTYFGSGPPMGWDDPDTTNSTAYTSYIWTGSGSTVIEYPFTGNGVPANGIIRADEIKG